MSFVFIGIIIIFIFEYNRIIDTKKFIYDTEPYFHFLMEDDYKFLLSVRYNGEIDVNKLFGQRVRNGLVTIVAMFFIFLSQMNFLYFLLSIIIGFIIFKLPYSNLKKYYKSNLYHINLMLPYYLKSLEILIQHYTVPVALSRSIETAPDIFKSGLKKLIAKIEAGDSTVEPYMDFAKEYPVRDSMRMMRLLYRLGLGSQENKQEQLMMFSRTVSALQNKSREQKYKERLEKMEGKTMLMLGGTGGGIIFLMLLSMMMLMQI
ncbi:MAG: hypothetical protein PHD10_00785 [Bacilli bacterium]|nr:hypothetical protein [Bacilli bacterium]MDD4607657.1 hypothetical protein [Bacilli bacterium]